MGIDFNIDITVLIKTFYLLSATIILIVRLIPDLANRFLDYGARETRNVAKPFSMTAIGRLLDNTATLKIQHSKFWHFYSLSSACTVFWVSHISHGGFLYLFRRYVPKHDTGKATSPAKIGLCFLLLWIQAIRRFRECASLSRDRSSNSSMWIGHYLIGMAFYFATNIAIFIEHVHLLLELNKFTSLFFQVDRGPSLLESMAFVLFIIASKKQHDYHIYLSQLVKYTLPDEAAFKHIVAPHYTAECAIYLSLAILSAPAGCYVNNTMLCALIFVVVNLGVTADGTKKWMLRKFPDKRKEVTRRWRMIPGIF